jgi:hypothetical protein
MTNNKTKYLKLSFITVIITCCLLFYGFALANPLIKTFNIPSQYGSIKESFSSSGVKQDVKPLIIHIQDAHCNYEAQKNMAGLLDHLVKEYNLKLIMVEGGSGDVTLSFLRGYADKQSRVEVADKYLKEGKISGEEYLDIISDYPLQLYGIEDQELYDAHMASFQQIDLFREEGARELQGLSMVVEGLKPFIYSEDLKQLEEKKVEYENKTLPLVEYCRYLGYMASKEAVNLDGYPHLSAFCDVARLEGEINFEQVEFQRDAFIKELARFLSEKEIQNLITMTQALKEKMIAPERYYSFLRDAGEAKINLENQYPQLYSYIQYINTSKDVDASVLLKEINTLEGKVEEALLSTPEQKRFSEITKSIQILNKALNLELTPEDYEYFQVHKNQLNTSSWIVFLTENCNKYNLNMQPSSAKLVDENFQQLEEFYKIGKKREEAFIKNMGNKINGSDEKLAVLITGGFHTTGIAQMLKENGYSYEIVTPAITQKSDPSLYFSVLKGQKAQNMEDTSGTDTDY